MAQTHSTTSKRTFKHLTPYKRGMIAALHFEGKSMQDIANSVGCDRSTIWRELKRGTVTQLKTGRIKYEAYFPETAQVKYEENRKACGAKLKLDETIKFIKFAEAKILNNEWSPDAVCGFAKRKNLFDRARVCTKTLYNYIELGLITVKNIDLPMKVRLNTKTKRSRVNKRVLDRSIEERPSEVEDREVFGHWENDTVIGKKSQDEALLTITKRKTRKKIILRFFAKSSEAVSAAICEIRRNYGPNTAKVFKTITADNGSEFSELDTSF